MGQWAAVGAQPKGRREGCRWDPQAVRGGATGGASSVKSCAESWAGWPSSALVPRGWRLLSTLVQRVSVTRTGSGTGEELTWLEFFHKAAPPLCASRHGLGLSDGDRTLC